MDKNNKDASDKNNEGFLIGLLFALDSIALVIYIVFRVCTRLKSKKILSVGTIDKIIDNFPDFKVFGSKTVELFLIVVNNEWFRGIGVTVLGGIILDKIIKKGEQKTLRRKQKDDEIRERIHQKMREQREQKSQLDKDSKNK